MAMAEYQHFDLDTVGEVIVLNLRNEDFFDRIIISELQDEMLVFFKNTKPDKLLINFGRVNGISSETLNAILKAREWIRANDGQLKLCDMSKTIRQVFRVTNLDRKVFEIHDSMHAALAAF